MGSSTSTRSSRTEVEEATFACLVELVISLELNGAMDGADYLYRLSVAGRRATEEGRNVFADALEAHVQAVKTHRHAVGLGPSGTP